MRVKIGKNITGEVNNMPRTNMKKSETRSDAERGAKEQRKLFSKAIEYLPNRPIDVYTIRS